MRKHSKTTKQKSVFFIVAAIIMIVAALAVFVVCRHDQHGHGVDRLHDAEIFFHGVCPPVILDLPFRQPYDTMEGKQKQVPTFL